MRNFRLKISNQVIDEVQLKLMDTLEGEGYPPGNHLQKINNRVFINLKIITNRVFTNLKLKNLPEIIL